MMQLGCERSWSLEPVCNEIMIIGEKYEIV